ncbi:13876_t:CDS:2, partial [Entrophospora sp. SA101]
VDNIVSKFGDNAIGNNYNNYNDHLSNDDDNCNGSIIDDSGTKEIKGQLKIDVEDDDITVTVNGNFFEIVLTFPEKQDLFIQLIFKKTLIIYVPFLIKE